jgi:hypothetical protein
MAAQELPGLAAREARVDDLPASAADAWKCA